MTDHIYRTVSLFWPEIGLGCSEIAAVMEVAAICCMSILHLPREPNSFIVRRIRFGERLKWRINIICFAGNTQLLFSLNWPNPTTKQYNNNRAA